MISSPDINTPESADTGAAHKPDAPEPPEQALRNSHGHKPRGRKDIASGVLRDRAEMIRLVVSPNGAIVPDIYGKLPGRGIWIDAQREAIEKALKTGAFARAAKRKVSVSKDLADMIEAGLSARVLGMLGMAKRAGQLESGFENVRTCARNEQVGVRVEASDGQADGRSKIRVVLKAIAQELELPMPIMIGCFSSAELGKVVGRDYIVHACVHPGKLAKAIKVEIKRLAEFRQLLPIEWPDRAHESLDPSPMEPLVTKPDNDAPLEGGI